MLRNTVISILGVPLVAGFVLGGLLLGCSDKEKSRPNPVFEEQNIELFYGFKGEDKAGTLCTTGEKEFKNKQEMCISLQSDAKNNNCASELRQAKFLKDCATGRSKDGFFMAKSCHVEIFDMSKNETLFNKEICAGRRQDGGIKVQDRIQYSKENIVLNLILKMAEHGKPLKGLILERRFHVPGENLNAENTIGPADEFHSKTQTDFQKAEREVQLIIDCVSVWACEK